MLPTLASLAWLPRRRRRRNYDDDDLVDDVHDDDSDDNDRRGDINRNAKSFMNEEVFKSGFNQNLSIDPSDRFTVNDSNNDST